MVAQAEPRAGETRRLDAGAWTKMALALLAEGGIDGVRIELVAKRLQVTKGSFYWHFKDRAALHESMLAHWRRMATLDLIERLDKGQNAPDERLRSLLRLPIVGRRSAWGADVELAVRLWGRKDPRAHDALKEVDELRLRYIGQLLGQYGYAAEESAARAILVYSYMRVAATLIATDAKRTMDDCELLLIGSPPDPAVSPKSRKKP